MGRNRKPYNFLQLTSAVLMILALMWLTVCTPFVYESQQRFAKQMELGNSPVDLGCNEDDPTNPLSNTNEEKKPSGNSLSEEYLHHHYAEDLFICPISPFHKSENASIYNAFHGEVHVPPPNQA